MFVKSQQHLHSIVGTVAVTFIIFLLLCICFIIVHAHHPLYTDLWVFVALLCASVGAFIKTQPALLYIVIITTY